MKVILNQVENLNFVATSESGHTIVMDGSPDDGGSNAGARPMEVVLAGLGGCSAIDVVLILQKSRQNATHCEIKIEAERADEIPKVFFEFIFIILSKAANLIPHLLVERLICL